MSLEQQIEKVAIGLNELVQVLTAEIKARNQATPAMVVTAAPPPKASPEPTKAAPKPVTKKTAAPVEEEEEAEDIPDEVVSAITRDLLKARGRDVTLGLLGSVGAMKATNIAPEYRAKYIADAKSLLAS